MAKEEGETATTMLGLSCRGRTKRLLSRPVTLGVVFGIVLVVFYWMNRNTVHERNISTTGPLHLIATMNNEEPVKQMDKIFNGVTVRFYVPESLPADNNKVIAYMHGGGWIGGSIRAADSICLSLAKAVEAVVISIEYRLAPKHPYPAAMLDCYNAITYVLSHAREYGIDPNRIALVGHSAGGNLVAAVALRLRDFKFQPQPKLQVLFNPCLQAIDFNTPSYQMSGKGRGLEKGTMASMWSQYALGKSLHATTLMANQHTSAEVKSFTSKRRLNHAHILKEYPLHDKYVKQKLNFGDEKLWKRIESIFTDPYFAPLMAEDLGNLPEALILTAEHDILRDEGLWYARYLRISKVDVTHRHVDGLHSSVMTPSTKAGALAQKTMFALIRQKL